LIKEKLIKTLIEVKVAAFGGLIQKGKYVKN